MTLYVVMSVILAYLLGAIPSSVWLGKIFFKVDVREFGSGNAGATNTIRVLGWKAGVPVLLVDVLKGWLAVSLAGWLNPEGTQDINFLYLKVGLAIAAVIGHIFPVYIGFRGGRGSGNPVGYRDCPLSDLCLDGSWCVYTGAISFQNCLLVEHSGFCKPSVFCLFCLSC